MRLGIDLGGTKIEIIALAQDGRELLRRRVATPQGDYQSILQMISSCVKTIEDELGQTGTVGVCTPGAISPASGLLKNSNSVCLNGRSIKIDLEGELGRAVRIANDANCFALSEATDGAAKGADVVFGVIIGTGVGGGLVVHGRVLAGPNAIAGEWGHNPLPWPRDDESPGPLCYCARHGCIETFLSGPGLARDHRRLTGQELTTHEIVARAAGGNVEAEASLRRYEDRMARSLAHVINILDPNVIVLGGGMSNLKRLYDNVPKTWSQYVFSDRVDTRLVPPKFGDSSGVRGAAWLWGESQPNVR
ncbi:MAG TPA: ROK family protein [Gammaproteobacteria bacterium]|nr:ROK family protein [Gammaproteobacteria bacterium]